MTNLRTGREFDAPTVTRREAIRGGLAAVLATGCAPWVARRADGGLLRGVGARLAANFVGVPTALDYVQYGLVAMWDGIENAGLETHDPSSDQ